MILMQGDTDMTRSNDSAEMAHLVSRDDRLWLVEPRYDSEKTGTLKLHEVTSVASDLGMKHDDLARMAEDRVIVGNFNFDRSQGNAVNITSAIFRNAKDDKAEQTIRDLANERIDVQLAREAVHEAVTGRPVGPGFTGLQKQADSLPTPSKRTGTKGPAIGLEPAQIQAGRNRSAAAGR